MRLYLTLLVTTLLLSPPLRAQHSFDDYLIYSALIELDNGASASGFFCQLGTNVFLATARHVLLAPNTTNLNARSATVIYYPNKQLTHTSTPTRAEMKIDLLGPSTNGLIRSHPTQDAVVVQVAKLIPRTPAGNMVYNEFTYCLYPIGINPLHPIYDDLKVGTDAFVFGYPRSIGIKDIPGLTLPEQIDYDLPLVKKCIVSGKNPKSRTIILDTPAHFGNSGGPVFALSNGAVIGLISEYIPFVERINNETYRYSYIQFSNSGYSVVVSTDSILEILW
jgi:hypothetical protein